MLSRIVILLTLNLARQFVLGRQPFASLQKATGYVFP